MTKKLAKTNNLGANDDNVISSQNYYDAWMQMPEVKKRRERENKGVNEITNIIMEAVSDLKPIDYRLVTEDSPRLEIMIRYRPTRNTPEFATVYRSQHMSIDLDKFNDYADKFTDIKF